MIVVLIVSACLIAEIEVQLARKLLGNKFFPEG